jgi:hypothetical protein
MRVLPILMAAAIGMASTAVLAQTAPNQPTTTEAARGKMDNSPDKAMTKKMTKKHTKKMKKSNM